MGPQLKEHKVSRLKASPAEQELEMLLRRAWASSKQFRPGLVKKGRTAGRRGASAA